jgi:protein-S-isoprenylcysteine O-methyltransferase Ste14
MSDIPSLGPRGEGWVAIQGVLFAAIALAGLLLPGTVSGPGGPAAAVAGWLLLALGAALAIAGLVGLRSADALTALPHPRDEARLHDAGPYRLVRHPIYGGLILGAAGWALLRGSVAALIGGAVLLVFFDLKRRREEAWLSERFPGYEAYRARTRRLIPWIY